MVAKRNKEKKSEKVATIPGRSFSWINPGLEVKETEKCGKGVFARESIKKDEILAVFGGYVVTLEEDDKLIDSIGDYALQISDRFAIGVVNEKDMPDAEYFNHSCQPNAGFKGHIFLVSMRNIKKNEEITFDYAMFLQKAKGSAEVYKLSCLCGRADCRKEITEDDWKNTDLQKKYDGYFQYDLQNKINALKKV